MQFGIYCTEKQEGEGDQRETGRQAHKVRTFTLDTLAKRCVSVPHVCLVQRKNFLV